MIEQVPIPTELSISHKSFLNRGSGTQDGFVELTITFPNGVILVYIDPNKIDEFVEQMKLHASLARSGLKIAGANGHKPD